MAPKIFIPRYPAASHAPRPAARRIHHALRRAAARIPLLPCAHPALPLLWAVTGYALWQLLRAPGFDRSRLWNASTLAPHLAAILGIFTVSALCLWLGVHRFAPQLEWSFIRRIPIF